MSKQDRISSIIVTFLLVFGCLVAALAQAPANRVTAQMDETTLLGNVHPKDRGLVRADRTYGIRVRRGK
jgi:hypothetical protein